MKFKKKPYKARKVFKRKSGGNKFQFSGRSSNWGNQMNLYPHPRPDTKIEDPQETQVGIVASMLQKLGFRVGAR